MPEYLIPTALILSGIVAAIYLLSIQIQKLTFYRCHQKPILPKNFKLAWELVQCQLAEDTDKDTHELAAIRCPITGKKEPHNFVYECYYGGFTWNHWDVHTFMTYTLEGKDGIYVKPNDNFVKMIMDAYKAHNLKPSENHDLYEFD